MNHFPRLRTKETQKIEQNSNRFLMVWLLGNIRKFKMRNLTTTGKMEKDCQKSPYKTSNEVVRRLEEP